MPKKKEDEIKKDESENPNLIAGSIEVKEE